MGMWSSNKALRAGAVWMALNLGPHEAYASPAIVVERIDVRDCRYVTVDVLGALSQEKSRSDVCLKAVIYSVTDSLNLVPGTDKSALYDRGYFISTPRLSAAETERLHHANPGDIVLIRGKLEFNECWTPDHVCAPIGKPILLLNGSIEFNQ